MMNNSRFLIRGVIKAVFKAHRGQRVETEFVQQQVLNENAQWLLNHK